MRYLTDLPVRLGKHRKMAEKLKTMRTEIYVRRLKNPKETQALKMIPKTQMMMNLVARNSQTSPPTK